MSFANSARQALRQRTPPMQRGDLDGAHGQVGIPGRIGAGCEETVERATPDQHPRAERERQAQMKPAPTG